MSFPGCSVVKNLPAKLETQVWPLGGECPLEEGMESHSSTLAWEILWIEEPGRLQSMGHKRDGHDLASKQKQHTHTHIYIYIYFFCVCGQGWGRDWKRPRRIRKGKINFEGEVMTEFVERKTVNHADWRWESYWQITEIYVRTRRCTDFHFQ